MQTVTPAKAMAVARTGIARLVAMVQPDGRFIYRYFPDDPSFDNVHYGEVRHVVAVWALVDYEREGLPIEGLLQAIDRAANFMHQRLFRAYGATDTLCVIDGGFVKLGGSAMGVAAELALFERTGDPALVARARQLARFMELLATSGQRRVHPGPHPGPGVAAASDQGSRVHRPAGAGAGVDERGDR